MTLRLNIELAADFVNIYFLALCKSMMEEQINLYRRCVEPATAFHKSSHQQMLLVLAAYASIRVLYFNSLQPVAVDGSLS